MGGQHHAAGHLQAQVLVQRGKGLLRFGGLDQVGGLGCLRQRYARRGQLHPAHGASTRQVQSVPSIGLGAHRQRERHEVAGCGAGMVGQHAVKVGGLLQHGHVAAQHVNRKIHDVG